MARQVCKVPHALMPKYTHDGETFRLHAYGGDMEVGPLAAFSILLPAVALLLAWFWPPVLLLAVLVMVGRLVFELVQTARRSRTSVYLRVTDHTVRASWTLDGTELNVEEWPLQDTGKIVVKGGAEPLLVVQLPGRSVCIPMARHLKSDAVWLSKHLSELGRNARIRLGTAAEVPAALRRMASRDQA
jgi:hypothetical protein